MMAEREPSPLGTAVVTGGSAGIGAATARRLRSAGFDVVIGARRVDRLNEVADGIGARALPLDVTDLPSVDAFAVAVEGDRPEVRTPPMKVPRPAPPFRSVAQILALQPTHRP
jgi:NADP-dependent 3-hydroxy acid dehydrogenase YdfG